MIPVLPFQSRLIRDESLTKILSKSRRTGGTYAAGIRAVIRANDPRHPCDTYYVGYDGLMGREFIRECTNIALKIGKVCRDTTERTTEMLFRELGPDGMPRDALAYSITFATGKKIMALTSNPRGLRGRKGEVILDEFAFHNDQQELFKAAKALTLRGGKVTIISTHYGLENYFNELVTKTKSGELKYSLHECTLDQAIEETIPIWPFGVYSQFAQEEELPDTYEAMLAWKQECLDQYADDPDGLMEELYCTPRPTGGTYFPSDRVFACGSKESELVRWHDAHDMLTLPVERQREIIRQLKADLAPKLERLRKLPQPCVLGQDFGRVGDITALALATVRPKRGCDVRLLIELRKAPFEMQQELVHFVLKAANVQAADIDSAGNGAQIAESVKQRLGEEAVLVGSTDCTWPKWYDWNLPRLKGCIEDAEITFPADSLVRVDFSKFKRNADGDPRLEKARDRVGRGEYRHGDAALAIAMAEAAASRWRGAVANYRVKKERRPDRGWFRRQKGKWSL